MKDYAHKEWLHDEPSSHQEKLEKAIGYLQAQHIYRGRTDCEHKYTRAEETNIAPRLAGVTQ